MNIDPEEILLLAAHTGLINEVQLGLDHGASPNLVDESGYPVLHLAALSNHPVGVRMLVERGAMLEALDEDHLTAFQLAIETKRFVSASALVTAGAVVSQQWPDHSTALHKLAEADRWMLIDDVSEAGCDVLALNDAGESALQIAARMGFARSVRALLVCGADISNLQGVSLRGEVAQAVSAWRAGLALLEAH